MAVQTAAKRAPGPKTLLALVVAGIWGLFAISFAVKIAPEANECRPGHKSDIATTRRPYLSDTRAELMDKAKAAGAIGVVSWAGMHGHETCDWLRSLEPLVVFDQNRRTIDQVWVPGDIKTPLDWDSYLKVIHGDSVSVTLANGKSGRILYSDATELAGRRQRLHNFGVYDKKPDDP